MSTAPALTPAALLAHDVAVSAAPLRRRFTATYKIKILTAADACAQTGDLAALLRREHLAAWRAARRRGELTGPAPRRGPTPTLPDPKIKQIADLQRQLSRATARAKRAEAIVAVQKKSRRSWTTCSRRTTTSTPGHADAHRHPARPTPRRPAALRRPRPRPRHLL